MSHLKQQNEVWSNLRTRFSLADKYEPTIRRTIEQHIRAVHLLNRTSVSAILLRMSSAFSRSEWPVVEHILRATFVYILRDHHPQMRAWNTSDLIYIYPEFSGVDDAELGRLLESRDTVLAALMIFDIKYRRLDILSLVRQICGISEAPNKENAHLELLLKRESQPISPPPTTPSTPIATKRAAPAIVVSDTDDQATRRSTRRRTAAAPSVRAFWDDLCERMEAGTDIPSVTAPDDLVHTCFMYPSHDISNLRGMRFGQCSSNALVCFNQAVAAAPDTTHTFQYDASGFNFQPHHTLYPHETPSHKDHNHKAHLIITHLHQSVDVPSINAVENVPNHHNNHHK